MLTFFANVILRKKKFVNLRKIHGYFYFFGEITLSFNSECSVVCSEI